MTLPKNILVPTDFSDNAKAALAYAVELAAKLDAKIHLFYALSFPVYGYDFIAGTVMDDMMTDAQRELDKLAAAQAGKVAMGPAVLKVGDARDEIVRAATAVHADLIVMGTHGRRGVSRALLGSVAESVARTAACPVLLIRG